VAEPELRTLDPDDLAALSDLRALAFGGPRRELTPALLTVPAERTVAAYDGSRLVGTVAVLDFVQWFGGRAVPCGGVAGVTIAPDRRGSGLARALLGEATARMRRGGKVISSLYPTTAALYRSLGWEIAGWWAKRAVPVGDLPRPSGEVTWEPVDHTDPTLGEVHATCATGRDGWVVPPSGWWEASGRRRHDDPTPSWSWLGRRDGAPVAMAVYGYTTSQRALYDLDVAAVAGTDGPALGDALAFLGVNGTTADRVITTLPERLVAAHVVEASRTRATFDWPWMLRIVDLPGAVAARGWPAGVSGEVHLDVSGPTVDDPDGATGPWVLRIADGVATCEPGGDATVRVGTGTLGALYAGGADPVALAFDGAIEGADDETLSLMGAAFAGAPTLPFFF
jgi:GNAT superfamily N-acetyltransferase